MSKFSVSFVEIKTKEFSTEKAFLKFLNGKKEQDILKIAEKVNIRWRNKKLSDFKNMEGIKNG